jgi:hypothetical protein
MSAFSARVGAHIEIDHLQQSPKREAVASRSFQGVPCHLREWHAAIGIGHAQEGAAAEKTSTVPAHAFVLDGPAASGGLCLDGQQQGAQQAAVGAQAGGDDVAVDVGVDLRAVDVAAEPMLQAQAQRREQARLLHHAAAEHEALRRGQQRDLCAQLPQVVRFDAPQRMIVRRLAEFATEAGVERGAAGEAFETVAMKRTDAVETAVVRMPARTQVAGFGMQQPVQRPPAHDQADTDTGAHGDVGQVIESLAGAPAAFGQRRRVDVGVQADGHGKPCGQRRHQACAAPAGLGRSEQPAVVRRARVEFERSETADADRAKIAVALRGRVQPVADLVPGARGIARR